MRPWVSRKATRSSPSSRTRTGGQSGSAISLASRAGIQYRRIAVPIGASPSTRVTSSFSSRDSIAYSPPLLRSIFAPLRLNCKHACPVRSGGVAGEGGAANVAHFAVVEAAGAVHRRAVVPHHEVEWPPGMRVDELALR